MDSLVEKLKSHIQFEEGMDDSMLDNYLSYATNYLKSGGHNESEYLILMVAGIMFDYRISEKGLKEALDAMTPFFVLEAMAINETTD